MDDTLVALGLFLLATKKERFFNKRRRLMAELEARLREIEERGPIPGSWFTSRLDRPPHNCRYTVDKVEGGRLYYSWIDPRTGFRETNSTFTHDRFNSYQDAIRSNLWSPGSVATLDSE